jgi:hypothetical protein
MFQASEPRLSRCFEARARVCSGLSPSLAAILCANGGSRFPSEVRRLPRADPELELANFSRDFR